MFGPSAYQPVPRCLTPPVDIYETGDAIIVAAEMPGVGKDQLKVEVVERELTIQGRVEHPSDGERLIRESTRCDYYRAFQISDSIDAENIEARVSDGVLTLTLPKTESATAREVFIETE